MISETMEEYQARIHEGAGRSTKAEKARETAQTALILAQVAAANLREAGEMLSEALEAAGCAAALDHQRVAGMVIEYWLELDSLTVDDLMACAAAEPVAVPS